MREASKEPDFLKHLEKVVLAAPNAETILARRREGLRMMKQMKSQG
jgi:hypothetical protein